MKHSLLTFLLTLCTTFVMVQAFGQNDLTPNPDRYKSEYADKKQKDVDKLLKKAQKEKYREDAYLDLGLIYYYGNSYIPQDCAKAVGYLSKSTPFGKVVTASIYWTGAPGVKCDKYDAPYYIKDLDASDIVKQEQTFIDFGAKDLYYKKLAEIDKTIKAKLKGLNKREKLLAAGEYAKYKSPTALQCILEKYQDIANNKDFLCEGDFMPVPQIYNPFTNQYDVVKDPKQYRFSQVEFKNTHIDDRMLNKKMYADWAHEIQEILKISATANIENAQDAYNKFKLGVLSIEDFFNKIKTASNQQEYCRYIPAVVFDYINKNKSKAYVVNSIFNKMADDKTISNSVINTLGVSCCRVNNNSVYIFTIFKKLRLNGTFQNYLNSSEDALATIDNNSSQNWIRTTNPDKINPFAGFAFYPNGKIIMRFSDGLYMPFSNSLSSNIEDLRKGDPIFWNASWPGAYQFLVYDPNGQSMFGILKRKGSGFNASYSPLKCIDGLYSDTYNSSDEYDLAFGYYLTNTGSLDRAYYAGFNTTSELLEAAQKAEKKAEKDRIDNRVSTVEKTNNALLKAMAQKYGQKQCDAMNRARPYEGMSEGIIKEFRVCTAPNNIGTIYGFARMEGICKVYTLTSRGRFLYSAGGIRYPRAIYVTGGKVIAIKW